jgi:hypothetical protein
VRFPEPWPPSQRTRIIEIRRGPALLELYGEPDGALVFVVGLPESRIEHKTQRVDFDKAGWAIMSARWSSGEARLDLNGQPLLSYEAATGVSKRIVTTEHPSGTSPSWTDAEAQSKCSNWTDWRARKFSGGHAAPKLGRRSKSHEEQLAELVRSTHILSNLAILVQQGHTHLLGHLATELRALVYWNGRNYSPLLLRLSASANAPLPIYMIRETDTVPVTDGLVGQIRRGEPSIVRIWPTQELADLQEWLESDVLSEQLAESANFVELNVKGVIAGVADSLGAAHYDPDLPSAIENLANVKGPITDEVTAILLLAASLTIPLSQYVVGANAAPPPNTR